MKVTARLQAVLLVIGALQGQTPGQAPDAKPGSIEGVVTNSVSGQPVKRATVVLQSFSVGIRQMVSDASGKFRFDEVRPATYTLFATSDGFVNVRQTNRRKDSVTVGADENLTGVSEPLTPLAQVSGRVVDEDGDPIQRAQVHALRQGYSRGAKKWMNAGGTQSNDLGEFEFLNLLPGRYRFRAAVPQRFAGRLPPHTRLSRPETSYPLTYYPNASDPGQSTISEVLPGANLTGIDFHLARVPSYHVHGKVAGNDGAEGARAFNIRLESESDQDAPLLAGASFFVDGTFDFPFVVSGSYTLVASRMDPGQRFASGMARQTITVTDHDLNDLVVTLEPGFQLAGKVVIDGAQPDQVRGGLSLESQGGMRSYYRTTIGTQGTFTFENLLPGVFFLQTQIPLAGAYLKSVRLGDQDVTDGLLDLTHATGGAVTLTFGSDGGTIQGSVQNASGEPAPNAAVTLAPADERLTRADLFKMTTVDSSGKFKLVNLVPGDYRVFAWQEVDYDLFQNSDFRKALGGRSVLVSLGANANESVQLTEISVEDAQKEEAKLP